MGTMILTCFLMILSFTVGDPVIRKPGYCSIRFNNIGMPIQNNIKAPLITGETLQHFKEMCPDLAFADSDDVRGCCDMNTLLYVKEAFYSAQKFFSECPACLRNVRNVYCEYLCSRNQSMFVRKTSFYNVNFYVTKNLVDGLYGSCKDVLFPGTTDKSISLACDTDVSQCTPAKLFDTLKIVDQPNFKIGELDPASNMTMNNKSMTRCNESFIDPFTRNKISRCSCENCRDSCPKPPVVAYETLDIEVRSTVQLPVDTYRVYQGNQVNFSGVVHKDVLKKIFTLQKKLTALTATKALSLQDVCYKPTINNPNKNCAIYSALQYYGLEEKNLNKCVTNMMEDCNDPHAFGAPAEDWHAQIFQCTRAPVSTTRFLNISCWSNFGVPIHPKHILGDYTMNRYTEAGSFKIKFLLDTSTIERKQKSMEWQKAAMEYLDNWSMNEAPNEQLSITYHTSSMSKTIARR